LVVGINLVSNMINQEIAILAGNFLYFPIDGGLVFVSILIMKRFGVTGSHGMAWLCLFGFAVMWFAADTIWAIEELVLEIEPFPSTADIFYILGYPFLLMFLLAYLVPVKKAISKKMIAIAIFMSMSILIPSLYNSIGTDSDLERLEIAIGVAYPIADAFVIIPALIGVSLFFRGQVNFMWTLVCIGIICVFIGDTAFLFAQMDNSYYTGHPLEILFHLTIVLIAFGVYDQLGIFKAKDHDTSSKNWSER